MNTTAAHRREMRSDMSADKGTQGNVSDPISATRAVKVLKYLRRTVPATIDRSSLDALEELPSSVLAQLGTTSDLDEVTKDEQLKKWLAKNPVPAPRAKASGPLFHGTLVFVQIIFQEAGQPPSGMSPADVQTARDYASLAIIPIQLYASQYGPNSVGAWPDVIPFTANVTGGSFTISQFEGWVDQCASTARESNVSNPCIVILHNRDLPNSPQFTGHRDSYHGMTGSGNPYCYSLVFGEDLNVADNNHTINGVPHDKVYAHNLSHEIAEMTVDPRADDSNPEVCDACAGNCNNSWFDLFDQSGVFMGGTADTATARGFAFFINSIVSANAPLDSKGCLVQASEAQSACVYPPPPFEAGLTQLSDTTPWRLIRSMGDLYWSSNPLQIEIARPSKLQVSGPTIFWASISSQPGEEIALYTEAPPDNGSLEFGALTFAKLKGLFFLYFVANYSDQFGNNTSKIKSISLDGGNAVGVVASSPAPIGVGDLVTDGSFLCWADGEGIRSLPLSGGAPMTTLAAGKGFEYLSVLGGTLYYAAQDVGLRHLNAILSVPTGGGTPSIVVGNRFSPITALYVLEAPPTIRGPFTERPETHGPPIVSDVIVVWGEADGAVYGYSTLGGEITTYQEPTAETTVESVYATEGRVLWLQEAGSVLQLLMNYGNVTTNLPLKAEDAPGEFYRLDVLADKVAAYWTDRYVEKYTF